MRKGFKTKIVMFVGMNIEHPYSMKMYAGMNIDSEQVCWSALRTDFNVYHSYSYKTLNSFHDVFAVIFIAI